MKALVDPFNVKRAPCLPDTIILPSHKYTTKASGIFSTGASGLGYVLFDPWKMAVRDNTSIDTYFVSPIISTLNTYNYTDMKYLTSDIGTCISIHGSNSPYTYFDLQSAKTQYRLVAAGIRVRYMGTSFRNQGRIIQYRTVSNASVPQNFTGAQMMNQPYTYSRPVRDGGQPYVYYVPDHPSYIGYNSPSYFYGESAAGGSDRFAYALLIEGGDTESPQSFEFEAEAHFELIGGNYSTSDSEGDSVGFNATLGALSTRAPISDPLSEVRKTIAGVAQQVLQSTTSYVAPLATAYLSNKVSSFANGLMQSQSVGPTIEYL